MKQQGFMRMGAQADPEEERKRVSADVRNNFIIFAVFCAAIRLAPYVLEKVQ